VLTIQVNLDRLAGGAGEGAAIAAALGDTRAALAGASRSAGAGGPRAAGAIADACAAWSTALDELGGAVGRLHSNLAAAARAYAVTDEQAIEP
jgi:ABC-type transporter Mla subunit MlaD